MNWLEAQFQNYSFSDDSYLPEYEAAKKINAIVKDAKLTSDNVKDIVGIFNETNEVPHNNGTGWRDLRLHIGTLVRKHKMSYQISSEGNLEIQEETQE
jgi:hypothetical protein